MLRTTSHLLLLAGLIPSLALGGGFRPDASKTLDASMRGYVDRGEVPCVVAVLDRPGQGEHFFATGARDISTGEPVRRDSIFCIYSISKMMTAAGAMRLIEEGLMRLDDPIEKFVPELAGRVVWKGGGGDETVPAERSPTIRDLLTHTAGYYYESTADGPLKEIAARQEGRVFLTDGEFLDFISQWPLHDQPGTRYRYSTGYAILGIAMARAAGESLEEVLQSRIFRPLGMKDTGFVIPEEKRARLVRICRRDDSGKLYIDPPSEARVPARGTFYAGGGDLFSTADDLVRFGRMLLNGGELDGVRILKQSSVQQMTSNQLARLDFPDVDYMARDALGLGVGLATKDSPDGLGFAGAYGWTGNASTLIQIDPKANLIAVVLSQVRPGNKEFYRDFLRGAYRCIDE